MTNPSNDIARLQAEAAQRDLIERELTARFAPEDAELRSANDRANAAGLPAIQISPIQGKLLQVLAVACGARKILEIGALAGYSGAWLARALPPDGRLMTLEVSAKHAEVARATFAAAGVADRVELRLGPALATLPTLVSEAPFDLIFIDANKDDYPAYLEWAVQLSRPGSIIVADNVIRSGRAFQTPPPDESAAGAAAYNAKLIADPRLISVAFPMDEGGLDGFAISVVRG
jgi:caffeoyl-CoA O-methyltransferase